MKKYLYLLTIIIIGCRQNNTITAESFDRVEESVTEAYNRLCEIHSGTDVEKILEYYTDDIIRIHPSGQIFAGKESLRIAKTKTRQENFYTLDEYSTPVVLTSVDQAVTYSTFKDTTISKETSDTVRTEGTWVVVWRKQSDNTWKIALSTFTENVK